MALLCSDRLWYCVFSSVDQFDTSRAEHSKDKRMLLRVQWGAAIIINSSVMHLVAVDAISHPLRIILQQFENSWLILVLDNSSVR